MAKAGKSKYSAKSAAQLQQMPEIIGGRFRALRKAKGHKSAELFAYSIGMDRKQYSEYENGKDMRMTTFLRLCDALEVTPDEFFKGLTP